MLGKYTIETLALAPGSDTLLNLYSPDATSLLASNDDHGPGLASQIVHAFPGPELTMLKAATSTCALWPEYKPTCCGFRQARCA